MWKTYEMVDFERKVPDPKAVRIGKLGQNASGEDHKMPGEMVRLTINRFSAFVNQMMPNLIKSKRDWLHCRIW
jgi:hypothetical protein